MPGNKKHGVKHKKFQFVQRSLKVAVYSTVIFLCLTEPSVLQFGSNFQIK